MLGIDNDDDDSFQMNLFYGGAPPRKKPKAPKEPKVTKAPPPKAKPLAPSSPPPPPPPPSSQAKPEEAKKPGRFQQQLSTEGEAEVKPKKRRYQKFQNEAARWGYNPEPEKEKPKEVRTSSLMSKDTFEGLGLCERMAKHLASPLLGFSQPTIIQRRTVEHFLAGKDVLVRAETGSGKTLAYLLPIIEMLQRRDNRIARSDGSYAIILAPTRELSNQIFEVLQKLVRAFHWIIPGIVSGGDSRDSEKARLRKGISILVATPGRLLDHLTNTTSFKVHNLRWLVLDEADRLLDLGFEKKIQQILTLLDSKRDGRDSPSRQNALISATLPDGVKRLASLSLTKPTYCTLDEDWNEPSGPNIATDARDQEISGAFHTPKQLEQSYLMVPSKERLSALSIFLKWKTTAVDDCKMVVFFSNCDSVDYHFHLFAKITFRDKIEEQSMPTPKKVKDRIEMEKKEEEEEEERKEEGDVGTTQSALFPSASLFKLHGNMDQEQRRVAFSMFKQSKQAVLLCTDVAARGLDLLAITWIVQYDPPADTRDYVHRVGRTARIGHSGNSLIFLLPSERSYVDYLASRNVTLQEMPLSTVYSAGRKRKANEEEGPGHHLQLILERFVIDNPQARELARKAFQSHVRAYATHPSHTKHIFHVSNLHLGHVGKSFALRDTPTELVTQAKGVAKKSKKAKAKVDAKDKVKHDFHKKIRFLERNTASEFQLA